MFWKASSGTNVIYLLGSVHVGSKDMYPLPTEVQDAFESSTALVVEVDINHLDKQKIQALFQGEGLYPGDDLLWNHVSKETRQEDVEQFGATYGIPAERLVQNEAVAGGNDDRHNGGEEEWHGSGVGDR